MTVYIGIQRGGGVLGWGNRLVTRSRFGHALIAFDDVAFSADGKAGWRFERVSLIRVPTRWYTFEATEAQIEAMLLWCETRRGAEYDWVSVFKFTLLYRLVGNSREARRDRSRFFCSEGVYACVEEAAGISLLGEVEPWEVAPGHFRFSSLLRRTLHPDFKGEVL